MTTRESGIVHTEILLPGHAPAGDYQERRGENHKRGNTGTGNSEVAGYRLVTSRMAGRLYGLPAMFVSDSFGYCG